MKIAILGAGFSGLALAWQLLKKNPHAQVTLFDPKGIGGEASGIAAGLLHPYSGLHAKYSRFGAEGTSAAKELLDAAQENSSETVFMQTGLLRPAITPSQHEDYKLCAEKHADVAWIGPEKFKVLSPLSPQGTCGIFISTALTVYSESYLQGLRRACTKRGAHLQIQGIETLAELDTFDLILLATGAATHKFFETESLPIRNVKGQILEFLWPQDLEPLSIPLNSQAYVLMSRDGKRCIAGSTYERDFTSSAPDPQKALEEILPKALSLVPQLAEMPLVSCKAGLRVSTPDHLPIVKQISQKCWVLTGMGSKGLLYHAYYAKKLIDQISLA